MTPTESVYLELKKFLQDINFIMEDGTWKHFEFQSQNVSVEDLKRFRAYEAVAGYLYNVEITTYVLYSGKIKNPITELKEGINTYRVIPLIMKEYDAEKYIEKIKRKVEKGEVLSKKELVPLTLSPLMGVKYHRRKEYVKYLK